MEQKIPCDQVVVQKIPVTRWWYLVVVDTLMVDTLMVMNNTQVWAQVVDLVVVVESQMLDLVVVMVVMVVNLVVVVVVVKQHCTRNPGDISFEFGACWKANVPPQQICCIRYNTAHHRHLGISE